MLLLEDAGRQRVRRVLIENGHHRLEDNRPVVKVFVHEVNRATRVLHSVFERLMLRVEPGKGRQQ